MSTPAGMSYPAETEKYLSESADFVESMPSQFSFEMFETPGNEMSDCPLCKVQSS